VEIATGTRITPKSVFQIGGSGQVGMSTVRGIPFLLVLRAAGCAIWPFEAIDPARSIVVEIYPRAVYGDTVTKLDAAHRIAWLAAHGVALTADVRAEAAQSDHAFDALASAIALWEDRGALGALPPARSDVERLEGRIWTPGLAA
jgi:hypothetical protein